MVREVATERSIGDMPSRLEREELEAILPGTLRAIVTPEMWARV